MVFLTVLSLLLSTSIPAFAAEKDKVLPTPTAATLSTGSKNSVVTPDDYIYGYRKVNVTTTYAWTPYYRVSDNLATGAAGGSISCNQTVTISTSITGNVFGINVGSGGSVSSSVGYTLNVGAYKTVYMGYRVYKKIETGTRQKYNIGSGAVVESNTYKVETPQYGEYTLINY